MEGRKDTKLLHRLLSFLFRLAAKLPLPLLHVVGAVFGWAVYGMSPNYRRHLRENLSHAGYGQARTRRAAIASAGRMLAEAPALWFRAHEEVAALVREVSGVEAAYAARARGEALLFLTPHMGCFEVTAQYLAHKAMAEGMSVTVLYRPSRLVWLEPVMHAGRSRANVRLAPADVSGVRQIFAALRACEPVGLLPDQVPSRGEGEWAAFFGRPAYTMTLAAKLAERDGVACFLAYARRLPRGGGYGIVLRPYLVKISGESPARRLNRALEALVRECPEQYLWGYNRYKVPRGVKAP
ncbi:MAG TPA: lysophospholipid acyltransferase family protein [Burkholderiales bacterium]|nr:lysophospholipid acyltransferase family protein [Burkholderiales bacterium]